MSTQQMFAPFEMWVPIQKLDSKQRIIAGYASVKGIDLQNELVTIPALKDAWAKFIKNIDYAHVHVMHTNIPVGKVVLEFTDNEGKLWKSGVDEIGLFIIVKIRDDIKKGNEVWELINVDPPILKGFSIGGEAITKVTVENGDSNLSYERIDKLELHEISVVNNPANQLSLFRVLKNANLVTREQVLRHTPNIVVEKGAVKLTGSLVKTGCGERFGLATPYDSTSISKNAPLKDAIHKEWLSQGRTDLIAKSEYKGDDSVLNAEGSEDLYDLVLIKSGTVNYNNDVLSEEIAKRVVFMPSQEIIEKMSIDQAKSKLIELYSKRREIDSKMYGSISPMKEPTAPAEIGVIEEPKKPTLTEEQRARMDAERSLVNLEIWAIEDGLKAKIRDSISKLQTGQPVANAQEVAGGFTLLVAKDEPNDNSKKQGEILMSEKETKPIEKGDRDAQILEVLQSFTKSITELLTKKEPMKDGKEEKAADPDLTDKTKKSEGSSTSGEIAGMNDTTAEEELSHGPCSAKGTKKAAKKEDEEEEEDCKAKKSFSPEEVSKLVNEEITKALENRGLPSVKKSLGASNVNDSNLIKKNDPLGMSLLELNNIPIERIAKNYPGVS